MSKERTNLPATTRLPMSPKMAAKVRKVNIPSKKDPWDVQSGGLRSGS